MYSYTFSTLNDKEFESLAIDLLSQEIGLRIERFKPGKDLGVDGRWFAAPNAEVVVQCKHWLGSGFDRMMAHLAKSERPKLDRLRCSRYILATSLPLSRLNKQRIAAVMAPYVSSESDVLGAEDLNDLLGRHPDVERRHYKLWVSSTNVMSLLLNNAIVGRSGAELEQIWHEAPIYVQTTDHDTASKQLSDKRVLVLTGEPGIGKTTLARQLVLEHAVSGFELVVLEESISEAENVYSKESKQLFYFDDFLGRTFLETLKAKQDSHILRFIERVARDARKRFILTSRTNILNQGAALSDLYTDVHIVKNTYELRVGALSPLDRARILYNHIWHSKLSPAFVEELYVQKRYHQVIAHKNFNPRLVAFVVDAGKVTDVTAPNYWSFVVGTLQNPAGVWSHFFSAQLSQDDRDLVYLVVLGGGHVSEHELREAFFAIPSAEPGNKGSIDSRFWRAVQHTSGSVLNRSLNDGGSRPIYELYNPSIADFVQGQLSKSGLWGYYYRCLRSVSAISRLEQVRDQPFLGPRAYRRVLWELHEAEEQRGQPTDAYNLRLVRLLVHEEPERPEAVSGLRRWLSAPFDVDEQSVATDCLALVESGMGVADEDILTERMEEIGEYFSMGEIAFDEPAVISDVLEALSRFGLDDAFRRVRKHVLREWIDNIDVHLSENNVLSSYLDPEESEAAVEELREFAAKQLGELGVALTDEELTSLCDHVDLDDVFADNIKTAMREDELADNWRHSHGAGVSDDAAIDDWFDRPDR